VKIKDIRKAGDKLGRAGLAKRALEIAREMVADGSYKRAIKGAGQLKVIAQACTFDDYWQEKSDSGEYSEHGKMKSVL